MSGFVRHCVITKECPETFLLFLYKTSLFPRLVQVLRICFLSRSLSTSLPLAPFLPRCLLLPLVRLRRHMNNTKGRFIGEIQCKFSVFAGAKEQECLSAENPPGGNIQTGRLWAISGLNQTEDSWKQTRNKAKLSELSRHMLQVAVLGEFPVLWCFHHKRMIVCNTQKMRRGIDFELRATKDLWFHGETGFYLCWWRSRGSLGRYTGCFVLMTSTFLPSCWFYTLSNISLFYTLGHIYPNTSTPTVKTTRPRMLVAFCQSK